MAFTNAELEAHARAICTPTIWLALVEIHDLRDDAVGTFYLGPWPNIWGGDPAIRPPAALPAPPHKALVGVPTFGRDADNFVVLDAPEVAPVQLGLTAGGHHQYLYLLAPVDPPWPNHFAQRPDGLTVTRIGRSGHTYRFGPFQLRFLDRAWRGEPLELEPPPPGAAFRVPRPLPLPPAPQPIARVEAVMSALNAAQSGRWFRPDPEMAGLVDTACAWVLERLDEHHARVGFEKPRAGGVYFARRLDEFLSQIETAWGEYKAPASGRDRYELCLQKQYRDHVGPELDAAVAGVSTAGVGPSSAWADQVGPALDAAGVPLNRPPAAWLLVRHAHHVRGPLSPPIDTGWYGDGSPITPHDPDRPSPWAPLLAIWARGAWPVPLPGRRWCVYAPHYQEQGRLAGAPLHGARAQEATYRRAPASAPKEPRPQKSIWPLNLPFYIYEDFFGRLLAFTPRARRGAARAKGGRK